MLTTPQICLEGEGGCLGKPPSPSNFPSPPEGASRATATAVGESGSFQGAMELCLDAPGKLYFPGSGQGHTPWRAALLGPAHPPPEMASPTRRRLLSNGPKWLIMRGSSG